MHPVGRFVRISRRARVGSWKRRHLMDTRTSTPGSRTRHRSPSSRLRLRILVLAAAAVCAGGSDIAAAEDKVDKVVVTTEIRYEPHPAVEPVELVRTVRLIAPGAVLHHVDCVIVLSKRPPADITRQVDDIAARISGELGATYERLLKRKVDVPTRVVVQGEGGDHHARARERGFRKHSSDTSNGVGYAIYFRAAYPKDADLGQAEVVATLAPTASIDARGHIRLSVTSTVRRETRGVPEDAAPEVVRALREDFYRRTDTDLASLIATLEAGTTALERKEKEAFLDGKTEVSAAVRFEWDRQARAFPVTVRGRLGRKVIESLPGGF